VSELAVGDDGGTRTITFDRPQVKNALSRAMRSEFCDLLDAADRDPAVRVVIVTGTDPAFCAGVDFNDMDPDFDPRERRFTVNPGRALRAMRTPTICAVNGACVSGGLEIALSCSFVVASERATFADTHARLDVLPAWGLTALLPRAVGVRKAREMSATGEPIDAAEAFRLGVANHVVAHEELLEFTSALAARVSDAPAVATVFALYEQGQNLDLDAALALEMTTYAHRGWDSAAFATSGRRLTADEPGDARS
jgi:enoyl-CoA hydratase